MSQSLQEERQKVSFNLQDLSNYIYEGEERYKKMMSAYKTLSEDPILRNDPSHHSRDRIELVKHAAKRTHRFHQVFNYSEADELIDVWNHFDNQLLASVSKFMFIPCIRILASDDQVQKYLEPALRFEILGAYAQTELGHGSDVRSLETTATYDSKTDEWVINTPTLTATKWWPGELGLSANHCICFAQMIIEGKNYGVHGFMVQIRDLQTNECLKGIQAGDIGPKFGYHTKDNGFLRFDNVRIPRENLLRRYVEVTRDGKFRRKGNEKIGYAIMMQTRSAITISCWKGLSQACTIGVRYSLVRTQFADESGKERKILDYQLQQDKLITNLGLTFAMHAGACRARDMINENIRRVLEKEDFSMMADTHNILSGTKAFYSWESLDAINCIRMGCGGHGYSSYSGFTNLYAELSTNPTHEGENSVMVLQTARYLVKALETLRNGKRLPEIVEYLSDLDKVIGGEAKLKAESVENLCLTTLLEIMRANAAYLVFSAGNVLMEGAQEGGFKESWDKKAGLDLQEAARGHIYYYSFKAFKDKVEREVKAENLKRVLERLCGLYALDKLVRYPQGLFESGYLNAEQFKLLKKKRNLLLEELRPDAIGLVDAFGYNDNTLRTAIGTYDGNVYENLWKWANTYNDFNKTNWKETWEKYIKDLRNIKRPVPKL